LGTEISKAKRQGRRMALGRIGVQTLKTKAKKQLLE